MTTCKEEAMRWIHRYALGGAAVAVLPQAISTPGLTALEAHMMKTIGEVYGEGSGGIMTSAAKGVLALLGQGLKLAARRATRTAPPKLAPVIRMGVAGVTIELIGLGLVLHYEGRVPGKAFKATHTTSMRDEDTSHRKTDGAPVASTHSART